MFKFFKPLNLHHRTVVIWLSTAAFVHNIVMNGAMNVIVSSLQKEFYLTGKEAGTYVSVYDIGSLISSLIVPVMGARGSKPRWIAFGMYMLCIGCFVNVLPHFLKSKISTNILVTSPLYENVTLKEGIIELCDANRVLGVNMSATDSIDVCKDTSIPEDASLNRLKYILFAANIINGLSSASLTTLALTYIEEIAPAKLTSVYEGIYYATGAFGLGIGFLITSQFLRLNTDLDRVSHIPKWFTSDHPNWIGAWWLPYLIFGAISSLLGIVICMFPRQIQNNNKNNGTLPKIITPDDDDESSALNAPLNSLPKQQNGKNRLNLSQVINEIGSTLSLHHVVPRENQIIKSKKKKFSYIFRSVVQLLKTPAFVCIVVASAIEGLLQNSFLAFISLYIENQYRIASNLASTLLGAITIPPVIIGSLLMGYIIKRYNWDNKNCLKFLSIALFLNVFVYFGFVVRCNQPNIILESDFKQHTQNTFDDKVIACLAQTKHLCQCQEQNYKPVCLHGSNDIVFQSPCVAGCSSHNFENGTYFGCALADCIMNSTKNDDGVESSQFTNGLCPRPTSCDYKLYIIGLSIFLLTLFNAMCYIPYIKITIGCNEPDMNAIALGIKQLAMTGIGTIPGPIVFGAIIDTTCKYWYTDCQNQSVCKIYNNTQFSIRFGYTGMALKFFVWILIFTAYLCVRKSNQDENKSENSSRTNETKIYKEDVTHKLNDL